MNWFRTTITSLLVLSLMANCWLGISLYKNSRLIQMQSSSYDGFKSLLDDAMKATDVAVKDQPGSNAQESDANRANMSLERAMGTIMGLRTDFAKNGMDIYPIFVAMIKSENPNPRDPAFVGKKSQNMMVLNSKTLHDLYSVLSSTSFTNAGLNELKKAVMSLDEKYPGYPSYSSLY
jgi:hypothetical protein